MPAPSLAARLLVCLALLLAIGVAAVPAIGAAASGNASATPTFGDPTSVAVTRSGTVYVSDAADHTIKKLSADGSLLAVWHAAPNGLRLQAPAPLAVDGAGHVYVLDGQELANGGVVHSVVKLSSDGHILARFAQSRLRNASLLAANSRGVVTVVVPANGPKGYGTVSRFIQLSPRGEQIASWTGYRAKHDFANPTAITVDGHGTVYASFVAGSCDRGCQGGDASLIETFSARGKRLFTWQFPAGVADGFGLAVDKQGKVYLAQDERIKKFSASGTILSTWGTIGCGPLQFHRLTSLALDAKRTLYATDGYNKNVQRLTTDGASLGLWGGCPPTTPPTPVAPTPAG